MLTRSLRWKGYVAGNGRAVATLRVCALCLIAILPASSACTKDDRPKYVGFVLDVSGPCVLESGQRIQAGQRIAAGATLHFQPQHSAADFVEIALGDGTEL